MKFQPISHSWVAVNPQPQGVVQFIGGAFFGTFIPMIFYRSLLQSLFEQGYTIVIYPFNFTFNHYVEAGFLIKEQYAVIPELVRIATKNLYEYENYLENTNYYWLGHSIGCKYISLLEGFSALPQNAEARDKFIRDLITKNQETRNFTADSVIADIELLIAELKREYIQGKNLIEYYISQALQYQSQTIKLKPEDVTIDKIFIKGQASVLLAPVNSGTDSAIPKPLAGIVDKIGLGVKPIPSLTFEIIKKANLFNLLGLIAFDQDTKLAFSTVKWFDHNYGDKNGDNHHPDYQDFRFTRNGGHLRPLSLRIGNIVFNFPDSVQVSLIEPVASRIEDFEIYVTKLFKNLDQKRREQDKS
ncbi:DUF1350 family protein [Anabaena sp. PCC 7108]|uniref:DUF1350 family protein n=1 Tax=Anabaena sp. PCC 7108 TaxID=163908 RepID=UPI001ED9BDB4|nr:DUF1350 family protein [Anabaena sp. PCC 7108]